MNLARRTLFQFAGGAAAGTVFTPIPWRLLFDSAAWSQNHHWIPKLAHGEMKTKFTTCTLCPASCPARLRTVGDQPVALVGIAATPESNGTLCPVGLAAHHLAWHPKRAVKPFRRVKRNGAVECQPLSAAEALALAGERLRKLPSGQSVVLLDERPGRVSSELYQKLVAKFPNGRYATSPQVEGSTLAALEALTGKPLAYNLSQATLVLSIGTPLLDGWGTPGRVFSARPNFRLIQVEPLLSRTAQAADRWIPVRPGTEAAFGLGLAHLLGQAAKLPEWTPERTQAITGIPVSVLVETAEALKKAKGALIIADGDPGGGPFAPEEQQLFAALNLLVNQALVAGSVSRKAHPVTDLADGSIGLLLCDSASSGAATPWPLISKKLAPGALVVSLSPYLEGYGRYAELVVPAPAFLESTQDAAAAPDSPVATFALAPALILPRDGTTEPVEFVSQLAGEPVLLADVLKQRVAAIHKSGEGELVSYADAKATPAKEFKTADDLAKALTDGALWRPAAPKPARVAAKFDLPLLALTRRLEQASKTDPARPLTLVTTGWRASAGNAQVSPLLTKLYQESDLRPEGNSVSIHPGTLQRLNLADGDRAILTTSCGSCPVGISADAGIMPGVIAAVIGPTVESLGASPRPSAASIADICSPDGESTWRVTSAALRRI